jgi:DHA2 family multidrug resistance protein
MTGIFSGGGAGTGSGGVSAQQHAYAMLQANVIRQSTMLAYIDNFWVLGVVIACLVPFVFLIKKAKLAGEIAVH